MNWGFWRLRLQLFVTCFRNINEWYPITSFLGEFNPKHPGGWGWAVQPPKHKLFLVRFWWNFCCIRFQSFLAKKNLLKEKNAFNLVASKIGAKLNNLIIYIDILCHFSKNFEYKINHNLKKKEWKNCFFIEFRTLRIFLDKKPNLATFYEGERGSACYQLGIIPYM